MGMEVLVRIAERAQWLESMWAFALQIVFLIMALCGFTFALLRPISHLRAARILDTAAGGNTVIPAAVSYTTAPIASPFVQLALRQANEHAARVSVQDAVAIPMPRAGWAFFVFLLLAFVLPGFVQPPPLHFRPVLLLLVQQELNIAPSFAREDPEFVVLKEELRDLIRQTELFGDPRTKELARQLEKLIQDVEKGLIQPAQAAQKASEIAKELENSAHTDPIIGEMDTAFEELAKALKKEKEFKDLAKALENKDFEGVKREMTRLEQVRTKKTPEEQQKMDAALQKAMNEAAQALEAKATRAEARARQLEAQNKTDEAKSARDEAQRFRQAAETVRNMGKSTQEKARELQKRMEEAQKVGDTQQAQALKRAMERMQKAQEQAQNQQGQQQGQQNTAKNMGNSVDQYMRSRSEQESRQRTSDAARDVREAMKRLRQQGGQCQGGSSGGTKPGVQDFFRRAAGEPPSGAKPGQKKPGGQPGSGVGLEDGGKLLGHSERTEVKTTDKQLESKRQSEGPTRQEVIYGASEKGFSRTQYKEVFTKYQEAAKEVLKDEKIPPGYKHLVKVYYRLIRPREGQELHDGAGKSSN